MLNLILTIIATTSIGVIIKLSEKRISQRLTMLLFNYIVATSISTALWFIYAAGGQPADNGVSPYSLTTAAIILAPTGGFIFAFNFFLMIAAIRKRGVALPVSLMRLSAIVPVLASILFLGEEPALLQILGMLGALTAAVLMSLSFRGGEQVKSSNKEPLIWLAVSSIVLLVLFGLADLAMKLFEEFGKPEQKPLFLALLFGFAGLTVLIAMIAGRIKVTKTDALWGILLGIPNYFASFFVVGALEELPSFIVFPTITASTVMLIALIARFFFRETIGKLGLVGIGLTIASVIAVNL